jgi:hypothetical protein
MENTFTDAQKRELEYAFQDGFRAFQEQLKVRDNPYSPVFGTYECHLYDQWIEGWYQAAHES